jgi:thiol-disulfide isomerase/thioredoxin
MKRLLSFIVLVLIGASLTAQTTAKDAPYKKDPNIPAFNILLTDSTWFGKDQVPFIKYDYVVIMYFDPECPHCQHEALGLAKNMDSLKNAFFILVAYKSLNDIKGFANYYGLDKFANVRVGRDPQYFIPSFYRITRNPFVVVYNKKGLLEKVYDPEVTEVPEPRDLIELMYKKN